MAALSASGTQLRDLAVELKALAQDWLKPLLAAQERFVLVLPPVAEEEHPIWLLIRRLLPTLQIRHVEAELDAADYVQPATDRRLPALTRHMHVAADLTSARPRQSFTALDELFNNPAVAVLKDAANLKGATLMAVEEEQRLLGTLAHRLVERLFEVLDVLKWTGDQVRGWFDANADALIEAEGAPLLMLGFGIALHRFKGTLRDSVVALVAHLQSAGVVRVSTEVDYIGELFEEPITGTVDLLAELPGSRFALVDLKWSSERYHRQRLESGTHLQLAIYAALVEQNLGQLPVELAFYVFDTSALLATSALVFPRALVCAPPPGVTVQQLLKRAEASWEWRGAQLAAGELELVDPRLGDLQDFQGPEGTLPVNEGKRWNAEYVALLGWEEGV
jgi:hypothetical protein